jgi:hypothetical protein
LRFHWIECENVFIWTCGAIPSGTDRSRVVARQRAKRLDVIDASRSFVVPQKPDLLLDMTGVPD